jgi:hypothetical protein
MVGELVLYGPLILAAAAITAAIVMRQRDLASTMQYRIILGGAGAIAVLWTGFLFVLWRSDL